MRIKCPKCLPIEGVEIPNFTINEKQKITRLVNDSPITAVRFLNTDFKLSLTVAKFIVSHINEVHDKCKRCDFNNLESEYANCPKCGSLNLNWMLKLN